MDHCGNIVGAFNVQGASRRTEPLEHILSTTQILDPESHCLQVWNVNHCGGVVGAFNVQGASWSRQRHGFVTHDAAPAVLETVVRPQDVAPFAGRAPSAGANPCSALHESGNIRNPACAVHGVRVAAGSRLEEVAGSCAAGCTCCAWPARVWCAVWVHRAPPAHRAVPAACLCCRAPPPALPQSVA